MRRKSVDDRERRFVFEAFDEILVHTMVCARRGGGAGSDVGEVDSGKAIGPDESFESVEGVSALRAGEDRGYFVVSDAVVDGYGNELMLSFGHDKPPKIQDCPARGSSGG